MHRYEEYWDFTSSTKSAIVQRTEMKNQKDNQIDKVIVRRVTKMK